MTNGDSTIDKQIQKRLGISIATWDKGIKLNWFVSPYYFKRGS